MTADWSSIVPWAILLLVVAGWLYAQKGPPHA